MKTAAIANQKGGTGKLATTHALGAVLVAEHQRRVLMVDIDPQSSLIEACASVDASGASLAEVLGGATLGTLPLKKIILELSDNLYLAPADLALAAIELGIMFYIVREITVNYWP
jgi:chromosome partitioning protein